MQSFPAREPKSFVSLPPEIRNTIYKLLVIKKTPVLVCSPRRKYTVNRELTSKSFSVLLRLNKQINSEASTIFYSKNQFVFGNGYWGSTYHPNVHGLKAFLERVPNRYLAHIANVVVEVHCRRYYNITITHPHWNYPYGLGNMNDASSLHSISRALASRFTRLEYLTFKKLDRGPYLDVQLAGTEMKGLTKDEATKQMEKTLRIVLKNVNLKKIRTFSNDFVDMEAAVEKILAKRPDLAGVLKVVEPRNPLLIDS